MGYESNVDGFIKKLGEKEYKFLKAVGALWKSAAKLLCPVSKPYGGTLRQDIDGRVLEKEKSVAVGNDVEYAVYVNKGTGIYAKDGNGRKKPWKYYDPKTGKYYLTRGQKPQPYLENSLMQQQANIKSLAADILGEVDDG